VIGQMIVIPGVRASCTLHDARTRDQLLALLAAWS